MDKKVRLEICTDSIDGVVNAFQGGADRIELCAALSEGGLTPSAALIKKAVEIAHNYSQAGKQRYVHVLIRPRMGDFLYSDDEKEIILDDIRYAVASGADGVVVGALLDTGDIDLPFLLSAREAAATAALTFHRAFDVCRNPLEAVENLIDAGADILLTSGQAPSAFDGIPTIKALKEKCGERLSIMAGSGVNSQNAYDIYTLTGADTIHASARSPQQSPMRYRHPVSMSAEVSDEYSRKVADVTEISKILKSIS